MTSKEFRALLGMLIRRGEPATPRCPHAKECGGCSFQDWHYREQVDSKRDALFTLFQQAGILKAEENAAFTVVPSPDPYHYRTRMDYVATKGRFGLRARGKFNYIVELETCHLIPPAGFMAAKAVWQAATELGLPDYNIRTHAGFLRYIVVRRSPDDALLLAAVTAEGPYEAELAQLAQTALAQPGVVSFHWLINDTLTDLSFGAPRRHWGEEHLPMRLGRHALLIGPNTFFQNNVHLQERLLDDVMQHATCNMQNPTQPPLPASQPPVVADLYGGVGAIALHLAEGAARVVTVESVPESADLARLNIARSGARNVQGVTADVLAFLREQSPGGYAVLVADPPRTGLGPEVCAEMLRLLPERIIYVSCNPLTQVADLALFQTGYDLMALRGYDMFPHTPHVETLAVLMRKNARA